MEKILGNSCNNFTKWSVLDDTILKDDTPATNF